MTNKTNTTTNNATVKVIATAVEAILADFVAENACVAINVPAFTDGQPTDLAVYYASHKDEFVYLRGSQISKDLQYHLDLGHRVIVRTNASKVPTATFSIKNTINAVKLEITRKEREEKDRAQAMKKRQKEAFRASIFQGDRYQIVNLVMKEDYSTGEWYVEQQEITQLAGEVARAIVATKGYSYTTPAQIKGKYIGAKAQTPDTINQDEVEGLLNEVVNETNREEKGRKIKALNKRVKTPIKTTEKRTYNLNDMFSLSYKSNFESVFDTKHVWVKDGKYYFKPKFANLAAEGCFEAPSNDGYVKQDLPEYVNMADKTDKIHDVSDAKHFLAINNTASGGRNITSLFVLYDTRLIEAISVGSHGILNRLNDKFFPADKIQNSVVRIMSGVTGSKVIGKYENVALFAGKFGVGQRLCAYAALSEKGLKELLGTLDGIAFYVGEGARQERPMSTKVFAYGITELLMKAMLNKYEQVVFDLTNPQELDKAQNVLDALFLGTDKELKASVEGKVIVLKKNPLKEQVDLYSDMNGYKTSWDLTMDFNIPVLEVPKVGTSGISKQFANKLLKANPEQAMAYLKKQAKLAVDKLIANLNTRSPLTQADMEDPYFGMLLSKFAPEWDQYDPKTRLQKVRLMMNSFENLINDFKIEIKDSRNLRAIPDIGAYFGVSFLRENEVFTKDIKAEIEMILLRYPSIAPKSFLACKNVDVKVICDRINKTSSLSSDEKRGIKDYFRRLPEACVILANSALLMGLMDGADFDFDMFIAIFDKEAVAIMKQMSAEMVDKTSEKGKYKNVLFNVEAMFDPLADIIASGAITIGELTIEYDWFIQLANMFTTKQYAEKTQQAFCIVLESALDRAFKMDRKEIQAYQNTLTEIKVDAFEYTGQALDDKGKISGAPDLVRMLRVNKPKKTEERTTEYVGLKRYKERADIGYVKITKAIRKDIANQLKTCKVTVDNFLTIIEDIITIATFDQEITIDSIKTSIFVDAFLIINQYFGVIGRLKYEYTVDVDGKITRNEMKLKKKWYLYDVFAEIRDEVEGYALPQIREYLQMPYKTKEVIDKIRVVEGNDDLKRASAVMKEMMSVYGMMTSYKIEHPDRDTKAMANEVNDFIRAIVRTVADGKNELSVTPGTIGAMAMHHSMFANKQLREGKINFNNMVFGLETLVCIGGLLKKPARVSERLTFVNADVQEGTYVLFIDGNGFVDNSGEIVATTSRRINGIFLIQSIEEDASGALYATDDLENQSNLNDYPINNVVFTVKGNHAFKTGSSIKIGAISGNAENSNRADVIVDGVTYQSSSRSTLGKVRNLFKKHTFEIVDCVAIPKSEDDKQEKTIILARPVVPETIDTEVVETEEAFDYTEEFTTSFVMAEEERAMEIDTTDMMFTGSVEFDNSAFDENGPF